MRVPMVIRYPRLAPMGWVDDRIVANIDIAPTLAEWAGAPLPPARDGRSLSRLIDSTAPVWREGLLVEIRDFHGFDYEGVITDDWKLVDYSSGERELYDRVNDPYELENRAGDPALAAIEIEMEDRLIELIKAASH